MLSCLLYSYFSYSFLEDEISNEIEDLNSQYECWSPYLGVQKVHVWEHLQTCGTRLKSNIYYFVQFCALPLRKPLPPLGQRWQMHLLVWSLR